jgi:16S rRNA (cytosine967-C5)-methyltransferase
MAAISPARKAAFQILMAVERGQAHSDELLRGRAVNVLSSPDRKLTTTLVLGVLRWQIRLDHQLQGLLKRPHTRLDPEVLTALRLGAFQLLYLDRIPARAVLSESVELTKQSGHRFASGLVNAVLRKLSTAPPANFTEETAEELALAQAHPAWMVERWSNFYGLEATRAICRHGQQQPSLTVRLANPDVEAELIEAGIGLEPGKLLTATRTVVAGDVTATEAFRQSRVRLQDEGSQLVAEVAGESGEQKVHDVLDACAAPGGKTLILAERYPTAHIVAFEASAPRLEQLRERLAYLGKRIEFRLTDAATMTEGPLYDLALADVPCSGTGTLGRNPEIRHRLCTEEITRQAERQRAILLAVLRTLRPGGRAVYSTCSLEPEEDEQVITAVLAAAPNTRLIPLATGLDTLRDRGALTSKGAEWLRTCLTPEGCLRLLPGKLHTDGFFLCTIERTP